MRLGRLLGDMVLLETGEDDVFDRLQVGRSQESLGAAFSYPISALFLCRGATRERGGTGVGPYGRPVTSGLSCANSFGLAGCQEYVSRAPILARLRPAFLLRATFRIAIIEDGGQG